MEDQLYTTKDAAERLGVTPRRVKYYCNLGLVPGIKRTRGGHRELTEEQMSQIGTLIWLRRCGYKMAKVRKYAALQRQGASTLPERIAILETGKRQIWQNYEELREQIDYLERQIAWLEDEEKRPF